MMSHGCSLFLLVIPGLVVIGTGGVSNNMRGKVVELATKDAWSREGVGQDNSSSKW